VEKTILMETNNIDFDDTFSVACNACLPPKDFAIGEDEIAKRRDLRKTLICSIDPATGKEGENCFLFFGFSPKRTNKLVIWMTH
jgi:exoribonuclease R